ncbi:MAG: hypothetical protein KJ847_03400 [Firmicutes bacterium]|nr:hypothetical protein [Bacillota bacterium]
MDNLIYKDYASWKIENHEVIETFKTNHSIIYERLEPVYVVLEHIFDLAVNQEEVDEDLETIFHVGFNYLHAQFDIIKIYFETLFQSKCDDFANYSNLILYLLFIFDIKSDLENNEIDSNIPELNDLEVLIENMIMERSEKFDFINDKMNETLKVVYAKMNYEYVSIIDIFVEIAENLGLFVFEEDEIVLGNDSCAFLLHIT